MKPEDADDPLAFTPEAQTRPLAPYSPSEVRTIAGSTKAGFRDGPAAEALFGGASAMTLDDAGNIYLADTYNHRIRRLGTDNIVSTVAGSGPSVEDQRRVSGSFKDGPASIAGFNRPVAIVYGLGALYVADRDNNRIRKVTLDGQVTTVAGNGERGYRDGLSSEAQFAEPEGVAIDRDGILYVADSGNQRIRKISPDGQVTTIVGPKGGRALYGNDLRRPKCLAITPDGTIYVGDWRNARVRKIAPDGEQSNLIARVDADKAPTGFATASDIGIDRQGNIYVADPGAWMVHVIGPGGQFQHLAGTGVKGTVDGPGDYAQFEQPTSLAVSASGAVFVFDNGLIRKITPKS
jgi:serine/threonine protein kinase, bacterial